MIEHEKYFEILNERLKEHNEFLTLYTEIFGNKKR